MKINKKKRFTKNKLLLATILAMVVVVALITYLYCFKGSLFGMSFKKQTPTTSLINYSPPSEEQKEAGDNVKENVVKSDTSKPGTSNDQPPAPVPQTSGKSKVNVAIPSSSQNGSNLKISSIISTVTTSGTCTLTLTKSGHNPVVKSAGVQALPSSSTCKGFDISTNELTSGAWQLTLHFENSEVAGDATGTVVVQ